MESLMKGITVVLLLHIASYGRVYCAQSQISFTNTALLNTTSFFDYASNATARIIPFDGIDLLNTSQQFFPAFVNFSEGEFTFSILMRGDGDADSSMKLVWTANHDQPVNEDASVGLMPDGSFVLWDSDGSTVWSSLTTGANNSTFSLDTDGCLRLSNTTNVTIWDSCENPCDGLLPGQALSLGEKLISQMGSSAVRGPYSLIMASSGLAMYFTIQNENPQPYWIWGAYGNDSSSVARTCNQTMAMELQWQVDDQTLEAVLFPDGSNSSSNYTVFCSSEVLSTSAENRSWALATLSEAVLDSLYQPPAFLRLDPDGNLRLYAYSNSSWQTAWEAISDKCLLPSTCKQYGVCRDGGTCDGCPVADSGEAMREGGQGCTPIYPPSCSSNGSMQMLTLTGVDYFATAYLNKTNVSSSGECKSLCSNSCSCAASFYCSATSNCVAVDAILGNLRYTGDSSYVAFLKVDERDILTDDSNSSSTVVKVVAGVGLSMATLIGGALLIFFLIRRKKAGSSVTDTSAGDYSDHDGMQLANLTGSVRFSYAELEVATSGFTEKLGQGGFGSVYRGLLKDGRVVAVKRLEEGVSCQGQKEFYTEVATLSSIHHWNLVQLYGFCVEKSQRLLVYEYFPNSSLDKWLFHARVEPGSPAAGCHLSWKNRYQIAVGVAKGLAYLHNGCQERIIHLDIKPQNILLNDDFEAKVADFGLSRLMGREQTHLMTTMKGTPGYVAPEWLLDPIICDKNDVYSYGLVLLELVSGRRNLRPRELQPTTSLQNNAGEYYYFPAHALRRLHEGRQAELVDPYVGSDYDPGELLKLVKVGLLCVQEEASKRPSMECVVQMLEGDKEIPDPPSHQNLHVFLEAHLRMLHPNNNGCNNSSRSLLSRFSFGTPSKRSFTRLNNNEDATREQQNGGSDLVVVYSEVSGR